jgi:hypothetical protein
MNLLLTGRGVWSPGRPPRGRSTVTCHARGGEDQRSTRRSSRRCIFARGTAQEFPSLPIRPPPKNFTREKKPMLEKGAPASPPHTYVADPHHHHRGWRKAHAARIVAVDDASTLTAAGSSRTPARDSRRESVIDFRKKPNQSRHIGIIRELKSGGGGRRPGRVGAPHAWPGL